MTTIKDQFPTVAFGTSGVRALVTDLTPDVIHHYTQAFLIRMEASGLIQPGSTVVIGMDLRPSSPAIAASVQAACQAKGYQVEFAGALPTPALALRCLASHAAGVMVTGSHIPFDRNGIKFYSPNGEILKDDEHAIAHGLISASTPLGNPSELKVNDTARLAYADRYLQCFPGQPLTGKRVGLYEHSAVGRDLTKEVLTALGATVISLGRSDAFVPVDTEAVSQEDTAQARGWCQAHQLDAVVSTDGDGDRPLVFNQLGEFVRGDLLGVLCAQALGVRLLAVPVSCNTAIEKSGYFTNVTRTRIGSPFVIATMMEMAQQHGQAVAGFEANGGFILGSAAGSLAALPTRDALLPMLSALVASAQQQKGLDALIAALPKRYTHSNRIKNFANSISSQLLNALATDASLRNALFADRGEIVDINTIDGVRLTFADQTIIHLRASGNAPELRCYTETEDPSHAETLCEATLALVEKRYIQNAS